MITDAGRHSPFARMAFLSLVASSALAVGSCTDPVHDLKVKALGGEKDGVPTGEFHRAGQPCVTCHGYLGPADMEFSIAGTIFNGPGKPVGEEGVQIELVDSLGNKPPGQVVTNCVGNFFITPDIWVPAYPVLVWIRKGDQLTKMNSHIGREPSCNECHKDPPSFDTPGHVHVFPADQTTPPPACAFSPIADIPGGTSP
jgi:hypothetical protein